MCPLQARGTPLMPITALGVMGLAPVQKPDSARGHAGSPRSLMSRHRVPHWPSKALGGEKELSLRRTLIKPPLPTRNERTALERWTVLYLTGNATLFY